MVLGYCVTACMQAVIITLGFPPVVSLMLSGFTCNTSRITPKGIPGMVINRPSEYALNVPASPYRAFPLLLVHITQASGPFFPAVSAYVETPALLRSMMSKTTLVSRAPAGDPSRRSAPRFPNRNDGTQALKIIRVTSRLSVIRSQPPNVSSNRFRDQNTTLPYPFPQFSAETIAGRFQAFSRKKPVPPFSLWCL